jgi:hypothetical protein
MRRSAALLALLVPALAAWGAKASSDDAGAATTATTPQRASASATPAFRDWTRFGYTASRADDAPHGLSAAQVKGLKEQRLKVPGTVDSSPIALKGVTVKGARHDVLVMTTTYGRTFALDAHSGKRLWTYTPSTYSKLKGTAQITTSTPVADPGRRYVFATTPDGHVRKLSLASGAEVRKGPWPASVTKNPSHEKLASALNISGRYVLATTGGYIGDAPPYQGKVLSINRSTGRVAHVFNSLCSNRRSIIDPSTCATQESAIWGRTGAVVDPVDHKVYATSSNGRFDGRTNWGDTVLELSPAIGHFLRHYTPSEYKQFEEQDTDLGSTSPALLPLPGKSRRTRYLVQGGKDGKLRLLSVKTSLFGVTGAAGRRTGGHKQIVAAPGGAQVFTAPAVAHTGSYTRLFVATNSGTSAFTLHKGKLVKLWSNGTGGTSPVLAGGLLYVYDPGGSLNVYTPRTGHRIAHLDAPSGHWNSPIVTGGSVYLPSGNANDHATSGVLSVFR